MPLTISDESLDGAPSIGRAYMPPDEPSAEPKNDEAALRYVTDLIERLPGMIAAATRAPVVHVEAPKAPEVKINAPVYVQPPDVKVPPTVVNVPEGKTPIVNIEPAAVTLKIHRPNKWKFDFKRDEYGRMISATCEDISEKT
jgi:hypothetical protein